MFDDVLEEMKNAGYKGALIKKDGKIVATNFPFEDPLPSILSSMLNVGDAIIKQSRDEPQEFEILLEDGILVAIPVKEYYMVSMVESREKKKDIREFAEKIK
ncbi:hypothetical protein JXB01_03810 [Candidatus Micrarchaeota archaeon]|nr:hypothetical protein [Candidatus Micrarchaeota archaeon]